MTRLLSLLLIAFWLAIAPAFAKVGGASGVANIAAGAQTISLGGRFTHVIVWLSSGSSTVHVNFLETTATTSHALLASGAGVARLDQPAPDISQVDYYGNGAVGTISYIAW